MEIALRLLLPALLACWIGCGRSGPERRDGPPPADERKPVAADQDAVGGQAEQRPSAPSGDTAKPPAGGPADGAAAQAEPMPVAPSVAESPTQPPVDEGPTAEQWRAWAEALQAGPADDGRRQAAIRELERLAEERAVDFMGLLQADLSETRRCAAFFLMDRVDPADPAIVEPFTAALADDDAVVRHIALSLVMRFPPQALTRSLPQLADMLAHSDEQAANRAAVARLLGRLEAAARPSLPALERALVEDPDRAVRSACLMAVSRIAKPDEAVAVFRKVLRHDADAPVRGLAAVRLGKYGSGAAGAAADLASALDDGDEGVRRKAAEALVAIGAASVPALATKLRAADPAARRLAVFALARIGPDAAPALEALKGLLKDEDEEVRKLAEVAIERITRGF